MAESADRFTVLIVPGLRDAVDEHWQTLLEKDLRKAGRPVASVVPMGRDNLGCSARVAAIERAAQSIEGPIVVVAHSGGCIMLAHWARRTKRAVRSTSTSPKRNTGSGSSPPEAARGRRRLARTRASSSPVPKGLVR